MILQWNNDDSDDIENEDSDLCDRSSIENDDSAKGNDDSSEMMIENDDSSVET